MNQVQNGKKCTRCSTWATASSFYINEKDAQAIVDIARSFNIEAQIVGYVEEAKGEHVRVESPFGAFDY